MKQQFVTANSIENFTEIVNNYLNDGWFIQPESIVFKLSSSNAPEGYFNLNKEFYAAVLIKS